MTAQPDIIVTVNDGDPPLGYVHETNRWWDVFHRFQPPEGWPGPSIRARIEQFGGALIHNPGMRTAPNMAINQFEIMRDLAAEHRRDADYLAKADFDEFTRAASKLKAEGFWLCCYVGNVHAMPPLENETPEEYADRLEAVLLPVLSITPRIDLFAFDACHGHAVDFSAPWWTKAQSEVVHGKFGGEARFLERLRDDYEIPIAYEPAILVDAPAVYHGGGCIVNENFYQEKLATGWTNWAGDLRPSDELGGRLIRHLSHFNPPGGVTLQQYAEETIVRDSGHSAAVNVLELWQ